MERSSSKPEIALHRFDGVKQYVQPYLYVQHDVRSGMISGLFISSICKTLLHKYDLEICSVHTHFGLGFYIVFTDTNFGSIFLLDFASNFNGMRLWGHILHPNFGVIYLASNFVT